MLGIMSFSSYIVVSVCPAVSETAEAHCSSVVLLLLLSLHIYSIID